MYYLNLIRSNYYNSEIIATIIETSIKLSIDQKIKPTAALRLFATCTSVIDTVTGEHRKKERVRIRERRGDSMKPCRTYFSTI